MPTFEDPIADSQEARQALRGLAHATRNIDEPRDAYQVIGNLLDGLRSLEQVLDQLATVHTSNVRRSYGEDREHRTGLTEVHVAASALHRASREIGRTQQALEVALQHSGRIVWGDPMPAIRAVENGRDLQVADPPGGAHRHDPGLGLR